MPKKEDKQKDSEDEKQNTPLKALERASQLHESEIVIELGADRFLQFIGVRLVIILAVVVKVTEFLNGNLSCHRANNETGFDLQFAKFVDAYCWESPIISEYMNSKELQKKNCDLGSQPESKKLLENPTVALHILRWLPYALLFEALLFALPSAWWHFRVGGRLMGHIKFMKMFIAQIYKNLKDLPAGFPTGVPYDEKSSHLDGWCEYKDPENLPFFKKESLDNNSAENHFKNFVEKVRGSRLIQNRNGGSLADNGQDEDLPTLRPRGKSTLRPRGKMLDRHLFSNLCYENFSSFKEYPYILSIFRVTYCAGFDDTEGSFSLDQSVLRLWCNKDNFSGRFLVIRYYLKHVFGIFVSLATLRTMAFIFELLGRDIWVSESFRCDVIYYETISIVCTMHRKTEMLAVLFLNLTIVLVHLAVSVWQIYFISNSRTRASSSFFEYTNDIGSVAMLAALRERQKKEQEAKDKNKP